jgi:uncharacterized protein (TIGR03086 family)
MRAEKSVLLPVSSDEAFAMITEPDRLRRWKTVSARVDLRAGGQYRWTVIPGHVAAGTFIEVEPGRRIVFGWGWEGSQDLAPDASTVTITLEPAEGGTLVRLVHDGLTEEQVSSHLEGWNHFLGRLEQVTSTGDAGPDAWAAVPADLNPLTCADATLAVCQDVLRGIGEGDLGRGTPCSDFTVSQLADHLVGSMVSLGGMAGGEVVPAGAGAPLESRVAHAAQQALEAWQRRGLEGTVKRGEGDMSAVLAASILPVELLVHAWDFAVATGQQVTVSDEVSGHTLALAREVISPQSRGRMFADALEEGPDANILDRLIAFSGRTAA